MDFLVVDTESFASYMSPPVSLQNTPPYGDHGGFLKLIDIMSYNPQLIAESAPGYKNELKVLGSLIFDDLYPLVVNLVQRPRDLWTCAMLHPNQVYIGIPTTKQKKAWDEIWQTRTMFWHAFKQWQERQGGN